MSFLSSAPSFHPVTCRLQQGCFTRPGLFDCHQCRSRTSSFDLEAKLKKKAEGSSWVHWVLEIRSCFAFQRVVDLHFSFIASHVSLCRVFRFFPSSARRSPFLDRSKKLAEAFGHVRSAQHVCTKNSGKDALAPGLLGSLLPMFDCLFVFFPQQGRYSTRATLHLSVVSVTPRIWSVITSKPMHALFWKDKTESIVSENSCKMKRKPTLSLQGILLAVCLSSFFSYFCCWLVG